MFCQDTNNTEKDSLGPTQKRLQEYREYEKSMKEKLMKDKSQLDSSTTDLKVKISRGKMLDLCDFLPKFDFDYLKDSKFPPETGINPYLNKLKEDAHNLVNMRLSQTIQAHSLPISS